MDRRDRQALLVILCIVFPLLVLHARAVYAPCDDSYIFYVYAQNLLEGNGLTFNGERVEGFSSPAWVALLAFFGLTGLELPTIGRVLSHVSSLLALIATYFLGRSLSLGSRWALLPVVALAASGDFAFYSSVGLEQCLFVGLVAACTAFASREKGEELLRSWGYLALVALMILTRPEGALVAGALWAVLAVRARSARLAVRWAVVLAAMLSPVFVVKRLYYGYWLPNTYYVKSAAGLANLQQGMEYLADALGRYGVAVAMLAALLLWHAWKRRPGALSPLVPSLLVLAVWVPYVCVQGGDNMVGGRVLIPVLPLVLVSIVYLASDFPVRITLPAMAALLGALVYGYQSDSRVADHAASWRQHYEVRKRLATRLRASFPDDTLIAVNPAGIIPYYSMLPAVDMLGLNDAHIAHAGKRDRSLRFGHQAGDGGYVLSRQPGVIVLGSAGSARPQRFISDREIWAHPDFQRDYERVDWPGIGHVWVRRPPEQSSPQ